jgi:hypothetical protein
MTLRRFSSLREPLDHAFLRDRLKSAKSYRRIAGYFRSSIFELVGEEIASIPKVQVVCNSELDAADVADLEACARDGTQGTLERGTRPRWRRSCTRTATVVCMSC